MSNLVINLSYNKSFFKFVGIHPIKKCTKVLLGSLRYKSMAIGALKYKVLAPNSLSIGPPKVLKYWAPKVLKYWAPKVLKYWALKYW